MYDKNVKRETFLTLIDTMLGRSTVSLKYNIIRQITQMQLKNQLEGEPCINGPRAWW